jgi:hypothetical protein
VTDWETLSPVESDLHQAPTFIDTANFDNFLGLCFGRHPVAPQCPGVPKAIRPARYLKKAFEIGFPSTNWLLISSDSQF